MVREMRPVIVVMAAGMGNRYGGAKQVDPMGSNGEIILDYSVYDAIRAGFERVVFVVREDFKLDFQKSMDSKIRGKIQTDYVCQELWDLPAGFSAPDARKKPWGTGHATLACRTILKDPFIVINADDFYGYQAFSTGYKALKNMGESLQSGFLVGYRLDKTLSTNGYVTRGVCETENNQLKKVVERKQISWESNGNVQFIEDGKRQGIKPDEIASMNFWGFSSDFMAMMNKHFETFLLHSSQDLNAEYLLPDAVDSLIQAGKLNISVLSSNAQWFGVTYHEDKPSVQANLAKLVAEGLYPSPIWS